MLAAIAPLLLVQPCLHILPHAATTPQQVKALLQGWRLAGTVHLSCQCSQLTRQLLAAQPAV
jgi:hypothetical protein